MFVTETVTEGSNSPAKINTESLQTQIEGMPDYHKSGKKIYHA